MPLAALVAAQRRHQAVATGLGLKPPPLRLAFVRAAVLAGALLLLGLAAARPALRTEEGRVVRTDAQAFFVVDVSRSMLAASGPQAPTRLERAKSVVLRLRASIPEVPAGVAGLTDRVLPYVFPTSDAGVFAGVLARAVIAESPPPREVRSVATSFDALADLQRRGFFPRGAKRRLCVVVGDGESRPFASDEVGAALLASPSCRLLVVRVGGAGERIFEPGGRPESQYRPLETAAASVQTLVAATGGRAFDEGAVAEAGRALGTLAGTGPKSHVGTGVSTTELAPYLAGAAAIAILTLLGAALPLRRFSLPLRNEMTTIARENQE